MQTDEFTAVRRLTHELAPLRGLWPGAVRDFLSMGFTALADFDGQDADKLAETYRGLTNRPADPLFPVFFMAVVRFAETGVPAPWWGILRTEPGLAWQPRASAPGFSRDVRSRAAVTRSAQAM